MAKPDFRAHFQKQSIHINESEASVFKAYVTGCHIVQVTNFPFASLKSTYTFDLRFPDKREREKEHT